MLLKDALKHLESLGNEKMRKQNIRHGAGDNQFGVRLDEIKKLAKKIKANHELALFYGTQKTLMQDFWQLLLLTQKNCR